jgi:hypothetical protein
VKPTIETIETIDTNFVLDLINKKYIKIHNDGNEKRYSTTLENILIYLKSGLGGKFDYVTIVERACHDDANYTTYGQIHKEFAHSRRNFRDWAKEPSNFSSPQTNYNQLGGRRRRRRTKKRARASRRTRRRATRIRRLPRRTRRRRPSRL